MMRAVGLPLALVLVSGATHVSSVCIIGDFKLVVEEGNCAFDDLKDEVAEFLSDPANASPDCTQDDAEDETVRIVGAANEEEAVAILETKCKEALDLYMTDTVHPIQDIPGYGKTFTQQYYNGASDWNEEVATLYPSNDEDVGTNLLKDDAEQVADFYAGNGTYGKVEWPDWMPNFDSCAFNAAYCCWPQDRQARDGNGNCKRPYDINCVDKNPGDNTNLCFVEHHVGTASTGYTTDSMDGWFTFPDDDNSNTENAEGPIHCHGLAWSDDPQDPSHMYRGNNLFYVSMYDHMQKRGYVRNIPGAPMCACAEQMPTVSRADCTQMDIAYNIEFSYISTSATLSVKIIKNDITFENCEGLDENLEDEENDLWSHINYLFTEGDISADKLVGLTQKLVGDNNCRVAEKKHMAERGLVRGYINNEDAWTLLASTHDSMGEHPGFGPFATNFLIDTEEPRILRRLCASCRISHRELYYKRISTVPDGFDLFNNLWTSKKKSGNQIYEDDFLIFSTFEDAEKEANAWSCKGYNYEKGFPGECGPGGTTAKGQEAIFGNLNSRPDVAWYVEDSDDTLTKLPSVQFGWTRLLGGAYEMGDKIYINAGGGDVWGYKDICRYYSEQHEGDAIVTVNIEYFQRVHALSKAGIMMRESLDEDAAHVSVLLTGKDGVQIIYRPSKGDRSYDGGWKESGLEIPTTWLRLKRQGDLFTAYKSEDGTNWNVLYHPVTVSMTPDVHVGLAVTSRQGSLTSEALFSEFEYEGFEWPSDPPSVSPAPAMAVDSDDVGSIPKGKAGSAIQQGDRWFLSSTSARIGSKADSFHFVTEEWKGDFVVTAKVYKPTLSHKWAKAGLMIREQLTAGSRNVFLCISGSKGVLFQTRKENNQGTKSIKRLKDDVPFSWLRLEKVGNKYTAYKSHDGIDWSFMASTTVNMKDEILQVGMALTSNKWKLESTAEFERYSVERYVANKRGLRGIEE